ncbi:hypothetical protein [Pseudomonas putida]|uniref:hypothetical protein n=1 Tax=Pseudomonas putida TaxID=303 RepID=UPI003D98DA77
MNNLVVAGWKPFKPGLAAMWSFFDQAFLLGLRQGLSTILLRVKRQQSGVNKPVDKSVIKLWKDSAEGRGYWLAAIACLTTRSRKSPWATRQGDEGQAKKFSNPAQSLVDSGLQLFHLPPETVDPLVDNVRAIGCRPRRVWLSAR